ncbi:MAG TPA: thioesterase family protein [Mycobacterium sp.]|nr:thioesterase family protein [Mycobacterium sp.]
MPDSHSFDRALRLDTIESNRRRGQTQPEWANMVGPFGGITAATILHAIETHPDCLGDPLALTVNFTAPIVDGDFVIALHTSRTNRTNQHWIAELNQDDAVKTTATAVFGIRRNSWADTQVAPPDTAPPEDITIGASERLPVWVGRYDMRFAEGALPDENGQPSSSSTTTVWVRDRAHRVMDYPALAALCDVFFPRVFLRRGQFVPAGTISLTTYFHADQEQLDAIGSDFVLGTAHANRFSGGYFDQSAQVWTRDGTLLATAHQIVYFKA